MRVCASNARGDGERRCDLAHGDRSARSGKQGARSAVAPLSAQTGASYNAAALEPTGDCWPQRQLPTSSRYSNRLRLRKRIARPWLPLCS